MHILYLFFIAFINSIDNIGVGVAYSIAGVKVQFRKNILISLIAFGVSYISSFSGDIISHYISEETASILSMLLLMSMGLRMIYEGYFKYRENNEIDKVAALGYKEAISVGIALALDDVGSSVSSGLIGYNAFMVSMPYFVISILIFLSANYGTKFFRKLKIGKKATIIAGLIMVMLGVMQIFE